MLLQDFKILGVLWFLFPLPMSKLKISTLEGQHICIERRRKNLMTLDINELQKIENLDELIYQYHLYNRRT
jgi:hypothetical protein